MLTQIWQFNVEPGGSSIIDLPKGSLVLSVAVQQDRPVLYALVNPSITQTEAWEVNAVPTGVPFAWNGAYQFVGTVMFNDNQWVQHIFVRQDNG